jgi:protein ImuB
VPLVMVRRAAGRRVIAAVDAAAEARGLRAGMAVSMAQALVATLEMRDEDAVADAAALERLALWALRRHAPLVAVDPPDGLRIDMTGAAHLAGGEAAWLALLHAQLARAGLCARLVLAPSYGGAHALARFGVAPVAAFSAEAARPLLRALPVEALRLEAEAGAALRRLGFADVGALADAPRAPLALRFGGEIGRRLDQMFGDASEPNIWLEAPGLVRVRRRFAEPIAAPETMARVMGEMVARLCVLLEREGRGARRLDLLCMRVDREVQAVRIGTAQPLRDAGRLTRLLCAKIETIDPGFGIEEMVLSASATEPLLASQARSALGTTPAPDVSDLVDGLANRIGGGRLFRLAAVESDLPERAVARVAALAPPTQRNWAGEGPRPVRLLDPPEGIETLALLPDHPPATFTWRGVRRRICRADGPERLFGEWWRSAAEEAAVRDYFRVEDEAGERFWLFRAGDGEDPASGSQRWYVHGIFA